MPVCAYAVYLRWTIWSACSYVRSHVYSHTHTRIQTKITSLFNRSQWNHTQTVNWLPLHQYIYDSHFESFIMIIFCYHRIQSVLFAFNAIHLLTQLNKSHHSNLFFLFSISNAIYCWCWAVWIFQHFIQINIDLKHKDWHRNLLYCFRTM